VYAVLFAAALRRWASPGAIDPVTHPGSPYSADPAP